MNTHTIDTSPEVAPAREIAREQVRETVRAYLRGAQGAPLYLATGPAGMDTTLLAMAASELCSMGRGERLLVCTGAEFAALWRDTVRRGMTQFVRRALAAKRAILLDGLEALRREPFAQGELARLVTPDRLIVLAGRDHHPRVVAWSPSLDTALRTATPLCLHDGPCVGDAVAWALVDQVAGYYGFTRTQLLSRRRTASLVLARQVAMHLLRREGLTSSHIGQLLHRDHSTVLYGDARVQRLATREASVHHDLAALRRDVGAA